ncbi:hypothetical protein M413DRAFT_437862 [Hebeloma cylindrosporum]|uniref:Uncharacterized protein n=1 Tax=Hebeloma cylindrosporum TaxID=76867 RepID=A0A0C2YG44_HEBCY|nr:hypothetical protein M413DRAFT_437862 [Hebeloma cylindrosporum h7]
MQVDIGRHFRFVRVNRISDSLPITPIVQGVLGRVPARIVLKSDPPPQMISAQHEPRL